MVLFPEGTRQSGPIVQPLFEGAAFVAARAGVPIVPVGIGGSEWAMPKGKKRILPGQGGRWSSGRPSSRRQPTGRGRVPRRVVAELSDRLHSELQALFDEALQAAGRA